jgi:hypothetical protein
MRRATIVVSIFLAATVLAGFQTGSVNAGNATMAPEKWREVGASEHPKIIKAYDGGYGS